MTMPRFLMRRSIRTCGRVAGPLRQRCSTVLKSIAPRYVEREGRGDYYVRIPTGHASKMFLAPISSCDHYDLPVECIRLQLFVGLSLESARRFYGDRALNRKRFLALADQGWALSPRLVFRVPAAPPRFEAKVIADPSTYISFWRRNRVWIRENMSKEFLTERWWTRLVAKGIVEEQQRLGVFTAFEPAERIDVCPGWHLSYSWLMDDAERLDTRRGNRPGWTGFVTDVGEKIRIACGVMGQNFADLIQNEMC
jgi:hypothetical protein